MNIAEKLTQIAENEQKVYEAGKKSQYDEFWDAYQQNGTRDSYMMAFAGSGWNVEIFRPKYDIQPTAASYLFYSNQTNIYDLKGHLESIGVKLDFSQCTSFNACFSYAFIHHVGVIDTTSCSEIIGLLAYASHTRTVEKLILKADGTQKFTDVVIGASNLTSILIEGTIGQNGLNFQWSPLLSHDSLMSIINALKDYSTDTSGTTWLVTLGSENLAKLTDEEKHIAQNKGWELA